MFWLIYMLNTKAAAASNYQFQAAECVRFRCEKYRCVQWLNHFAFGELLLSALICLELEST